MEKKWKTPDRLIPHQVIVNIGDSALQDTIEFPMITPEMLAEYDNNSPPEEE